MKKILFLLIILIFSATSYSQDSVKIEKKPSEFGIALGVSASTNGLGVSLVTALNKRFAIRLSYEKLDNSLIKNFYPIDEPKNVALSDQELSLVPIIKIGGISAIIDFYLFRSFYLCAGAVYTDFNLTADTKLDKITINKVTLENQGGLTLNIQPERKLSPYVGLGIGRNISRDHRLTMNFEVGAYHMGSYVLTQSGTGLLSENNSESLKSLNQTLKDISWSGIYPILKLGFSYKFISKNK